VDDEGPGVEPVVETVALDLGAEVVEEPRVHGGHQNKENRLKKLQEEHRGVLDS